MTQNMRPELISLAGKIIDEHLKTGGNTSLLIAKVANDRGYNDKLVGKLTGLTNQEYVIKTGDHSVPDIADPDIVMANLKRYSNEPMSKTASYKYPEYNAVNSMSKSASCGGEKKATQRNVIGIMRKMANDDSVNFKIKRASIEVDFDKLYKSASESIDFAKRSGFNLDDIKTYTKKANCEITEFIFNSNPAKPHHGINKNLYNISDKMQKLASDLEKMDCLLKDRNAINNELNEVEWIKSQLKNTAEVMIDV